MSLDKLCKNSEYFDRLINSGFQESYKNVVKIEDVNYDNLLKLIIGINTNKLHITEDNFIDLLKLSDILFICCFNERICNFIKNQIKNQIKK
jgi:hypothetical protein